MKGTVCEMKTLDGKGNTIEVIDVDQAFNELKQSAFNLFDEHTYTRENL